MNNPDYSQYPNDYSLCFLEDCKLKEQCSHYIAGQHIRKDHYQGHAIFKTMLDRKDGCIQYHKLRTIKGAWGFDTLFDNIKYKDSAAVRRAVKAYLGSNTTYSRYKNGQLLLSPEQQTWIINLFKKYGYTDNLRFDNYKEIIDW